MCVLTLHRVVKAPERPHDISWDSLHRLLDVVSHVTAELELSSDVQRSVAITLDDGTRDHAEVGELLETRSLRGIFFVPPSALGRRGFLTESQLGELRRQGHEIGSHGLNNVRFDRLSSAQLRRELRVSKERLEDVIQRDVRYLAPPGGSNHPDLVKELQESGYRAARCVRWGIHDSPAQRWRIPSIPVTEFTISRGWVNRVLATWQLPWTMEFIWFGKELLPIRTRSRVRGWTNYRRLAVRD